MVQVVHDVYLVGGRHFYLTIRDDADCNAYAVKTTEGVVLIDPGYSSVSLETIFRSLRYWRMNPDDVRYVLLSHSHFDHTGNARELQRRGAKLVAHHAAADALAAGDERTIPYAFYRGDFPTCEVDVRVSDGDVVALGDKRFRVIGVPGHTNGSVAYLTEAGGKSVLFVGDFVFHERPETTEGSLAWAGGTEHDTDAFLESLLKIQQLRVDVLLPGHNGFLVEQGTAIVDRALTVALRAWGNKFAERRSPKGAGR
jgi:glyoxylase-like metal-dependent hydrolase (beta-lactamase superfamily II)